MENEDVIFTMVATLLLIIGYDLLENGQAVPRLRRRHIIRSTANLDIALRRLQHDAETFRANFRLSPGVFAVLLQKLSPALNRDRTRLLEPIHEILLTLHRLGSRAFCRTTGEHFGLGKSTIFYAYWRVIRAINAILLPRLIKWPDGDKLDTVRQRFHDIAGVPDVVGAIDCTHIGVYPPAETATDYLDRTRRHSIIAQAVVNADGMFQDIYVGWPGSVHDQRVFRNSPLSEQIRQGRWVTGNDVLLADSGYALSNKVITPFDCRGHRQLTESERAFNYAHSRTRTVVERAFGRLETRFRILHDAVEGNVGGVVETVTACMTLHNLAILLNDTDDFVDTQPPDEYPQEPFRMEAAANATGRQRRQQLLNDMIAAGVL